MECLKLHPHLSTLSNGTLLQNPTNNTKQSTQKNAMEKFQGFIFRLAEAHPNAPLTPSSRTLLQDRLNKFASQYKTPDHPPYSAMIERALRELNDKRGSSEDSTSQFLEKAYSNLPLAHSTLLKHHLGKLCQSGDIVVIRDKRYLLAGENSTPGSSKNVKRKPTRRKLRWDLRRESNRRRKKQLIKKQNQQKGKEVVEKEMQLIEYGVQGEEELVKENQTCDRENGVGGDPCFFAAELQCLTSANGTIYYKRSHQQEIGPCGIVEAAHTGEQQEREQTKYNPPRLSSPERPPRFEHIKFENLSHLGPTELALASSEEFFESKRTLRQLRRWSRRFCEPEIVAITPSELVAASKSEEHHSLQLEHSCQGRHQDQQKILESTPITSQKMHHDMHTELRKADVVEVAQPVMSNTNVNGVKIYHRRMKLTSKGSQTTDMDVSLRLEQPTQLQSAHLLEPRSNVGSLSSSLTVHQAKSKLLNEQEPRELLQQPPQEEEIFQMKQPCRSLRAHPAKPEVNKDGNSVGVLRECPKRFYELQSRQSKQNSGDQEHLEPLKSACADEWQHQPEVVQLPKSQRQRRLIKPKPNAMNVENLTFVDDHSRQGLGLSGKLASCTSISMCDKTEAVLPLCDFEHKEHEKETKTQLYRRVPKHQSAQPPIDKMNSAETEGIHLPLDIILALDQPKVQHPGNLTGMKVVRD